MATNLSKPQTVRDLAQVLGVSTATISKAFTGNGRMAAQTRERVLAAAAEYGFVPNPHAQRLSVGSCPDMIGIFARYVDLGVQSEKIQIIQTKLLECGFNVPLYTGGYGFPDSKIINGLLSSLRRQKPRAIVCATRALVASTFDELRLYIEEGGVVVTYDQRHDLECDRVILDRQQSISNATRHFLKLGHRKIGYFHHASRSVDDRFDGFCQTLRENGLEPNENWVFDGSVSAQTELAGVDFAARFLGLPPASRPTAVLIVNDLTALTFIAEIKRAGVRVPRDVAVIGHDNRPLGAHAQVPLSSVSHPTEEIGEAVLELLQSRLDGFDGFDGPPREVVVQSQLIVRQSCGASKSF